LNTDRTIFEDQALKDNFILITLNVDHGDSTNVKDQLNYSLLAVQKYPDRIFYAPTFYFDTTGWEQDNWSNKVIEQLRRNISKGAVSVKFWKNIGMTVRDRKGNFIMFDNPKLDPVIDFIVKSNLPVTGHLGEPKDCWLPLDKMTVNTDSSYYVANPKYHMYLHPEYPSYDAQINARDNMVAKHPEMQFIGCHLGSLEWSVDELAKRLDKFPNMSVDLAERIVHFQYQSVKDYNKVRNFCIKYQDRILCGTDMSDNGRSNPDQLIAHFHNIWTTDWHYFTSGKEMTSEAFKGKFKALHLPKEVVNKIFRDNSIRWYKLPVK
jgi:predicted TIM-barrel fold metal-dependent hydrolase